MKQQGAWLRQRLRCQQPARHNQRVGESHDWQAQPIFGIKKQLHPGDNVIAVRVKNDEGGGGGLNLDVNVEIAGQSVASPWSRSLFNGLAQIIVQSTKEAGETRGCGPHW